MKPITTLATALFIAGYLQAQTQSFCIGEVRTLHSAILKEDRTLNIYLPEGYSAEKTYPVIYLLDGSFNEDFLHITGNVQFFNLMFGMPETIVVGIANVDRKRDFTFHTDVPDLKRDFPTTGHSDLFIQFIENELIPYVQQQYKSNGTRYLIGQSLGGLLATEILLKKTHLFTHYLIVSPSLWWDNESLPGKAGAIYPTQTAVPEFVYISVGKQETKKMRGYAKGLYRTLKSAKNKPKKLVFNPMKKENHATILHRSIYEAFLALFPYRE